MRAFVLLAVLALAACKAEVSHTPDAQFKGECFKKQGTLVKITGGLWLCRLPDGTEIKQ
jgi:hypothetical protein